MLAAFANILVVILLASLLILHWPTSSSSKSPSFSISPLGSLVSCIALYPSPSYSIFDSLPHPNLSHLIDQIICTLLFPSPFLLKSPILATALFYFLDSVVTPIYAFTHSHLNIWSEEFPMREHVIVNMMFSSSIHVLIKFKISFFFTAIVFCLVYVAFFIINLYRIFLCPRMCSILEKLPYAAG